MGYIYGITRAHILDGFSHFIFDAATLGLYWARFSRSDAEAADRSRRAMAWLQLLVAWPLLMLIVPQQHYLIQLIGLRAAVFFLPLLVIGARSEKSDLDTLSTWLAALNAGACVVAVAEFFIGIEAFLPRNSVTALIYISKDVAGGEYRIPATFPSAHAYAGTMVATMPFLVGRWLQADSSERWAFAASIAATAAGVFIAAARSPVVQLAIVLIASAPSLRIPMRAKLGLVPIGCAVAWLVGMSERFQRFTTLSDTALVADRIGMSVHLSFFDLVQSYPLGTGLGSAIGTSIPFFLQHLVGKQIGMENEYGRIVVEQGIVGLGLWIAFLFATIRHRWKAVSPGWERGTKLTKAYVVVAWVTAVIGTGMLTSIPSTLILVFQMGLLWREPLRAHTPASALRRNDRVGL